MTRYLLDVNVLIALIDEEHVHFPRAQRWFVNDPEIDWIICPLVQLGVVRIASNPQFGSSSSVKRAAESLDSVLALGRCSWVSDDLDLMDDLVFDHQAILTHSQLTDTYLLALAARHRAVLATFDRRISKLGARSPDAEVFLIPYSRIRYDGEYP